ncbi:hypothetical protein [Desulfosporosinus sp. BG]|nr:hypothetical protein [Desulfosporosinus sp. BG]ODA41057.1 hypothetical protein DSBG_2095 [Desulfosporosinus sp. BG]
MPRKPREITLKVTIKLVPHPDPERAKRVIAEIVLNQLLKEKAESK